MANYKQSYLKIMGYEGGYSNDEDDIGGQTYKGISMVYHPDWGGWAIIDKLKKEPDFPANLKKNVELNDMVILFYKPKYWDVFRGDDIAFQGIADEMLDISINLGYKRAVIFLQKALNVLNRNASLYTDITMDGVIGKNTITALDFFMKKDGNANFIIKILNILQGEHYINRMLEDPTQEKFCRGWLDRVELNKN